MTTPKRIFRISKEDLQNLINYHTIRDTQTGNSIATFLWQYMKKIWTQKTDTFEMTRTGLLREATWARKNGFIEWSQLVSNWAELAEVPI